MALEFILGKQVSQKIVIDGYNVLHLVEAYKSKLDSDLESARNQLIHDLKLYQAIKKVEILIVFDGSAEIPSPFQQKTEGRIVIVFSRAPQKADNVIMELLTLEKQTGRITVVTNDNEIIKFAKSSGSHCISPQEFYLRIKARSIEQQLECKFDNDMSAEELEEWKKIFGIEDE